MMSWTSVNTGIYMTVVRLKVAFPLARRSIAKQSRFWRDKSAVSGGSLDLNGVRS